MIKINWVSLFILAIPGVVHFMLLHNYILYGMRPSETIADIVWAIFN